MTKFTDLGLSQPLLDALAAKNYTEPTPIQAQGHPDRPAGPRPARHRPDRHRQDRGLHAAVARPPGRGRHRPPDRRAAPACWCSPRPANSPSQIAESARTYAKGQHISVGVIFGGIPVPKSIREVSRGLDVLVATPGRLLDLVDQRALDLSALEILVLDEADQMLDLGFIHALKRIVKLIPAKRQTLFFSATMPKAIQQLADAYLTNPAEVAVTPVATTVDRIEQTRHPRQPGREAGAAHPRPAEARRSSARSSSAAPSMAPTRSSACSRPPASRPVRSTATRARPQRERALGAFRTGSMPVLVATDIAARGIDIPGVSHVVNFDLPDVPEQYVHRIGRTARAGAEGQAIAFCSPDERVNLRDIEKLVRIKIEQAALPEGFMETVAAIKRLKPAKKADDGQDHGRGGRRSPHGMKSDRRADGQRRDHRNGPRSDKPQYQPKRADGSVPGEARGPVRNPVRSGEPARGPQRHPQRADGHPARRPDGNGGKRPFQGRRGPGGPRRAEGGSARA